MGYELTHSTYKEVSRGRYYPLGATPSEEGVNFALYSEHASEVFLLFFDSPAGERSGGSLSSTGPIRLYILPRVPAGIRLFLPAPRVKRVQRTHNFVGKRLLT
jgi:pullulanase/glycogen debranching enzyme